MSESKPTIRVLFLCTGNSCRSQMAEGWARVMHGERVEAHSAGVDPHTLDPRAVLVMKESGVDISGQHSKSLGDVDHISFDLAVTVCDKARESCPVFPSASRTVHAGFDDPPYLARNAASEQEALVFYRRVRDEIRDYVANELPTLLE